MSRYALFTDDENLEIFLGFDEGFQGFFLTIADGRAGTGEPESHLFHNLEHHPGVRMTLEEVVGVMKRFGVALPPDLRRQLVEDARRGGVFGAASADAHNAPTLLQPAVRQRTLTILGWQSAL